MSIRRFSWLICAPVMLLAGPALADDLVFSDTDFSYADPDENVVLRGSIGAASITAHEHVYAGTSGDENLSLLVWESKAPIASTELKIRLPGEWTLRGHIQAAMGGDSNMTDYDWLTFAPSYDPDDFDNRSISPNTSLDWYVDGDIAIGRDLPISNELTVNLNGGFKYTDVQWTAVGGTYTYSSAGLFDTSGTLPDVPGVRYRQQLPELFAGLDTTVKDGPWSMEVGAKAGLAIAATGTDHHYLRTPPLLFVDHLDYAQVYSAKINLGYAFNEHLGAFLEGSYETVKSPHGDTDVYNDTTGVQITHETGAAGGDLDTASLMAGIKGNF